MAVTAHALPFRCLTDDVISDLLVDDPSLLLSFGPAPDNAQTRSVATSVARLGSGGGLHGRNGGGAAGGAVAVDGFDDTEEAVDPRALLALMCCALATLHYAPSAGSPAGGTAAGTHSAEPALSSSSSSSSLAFGRDCAWQARQVLVHLGNHCQLQLLRRQQKKARDGDELDVPSIDSSAASALGEAKATDFLFSLPSSDRTPDTKPSLRTEAGAQSAGGVESGSGSGPRSAAGTDDAALRCLLEQLNVLNPTPVKDDRVTRGASAMEAYNSTWVGCRGGPGEELATSAARRYGAARHHVTGVE